MCQLSLWSRPHRLENGKSAWMASHHYRARLRSCNTFHPCAGARLRSRMRGDLFTFSWVCKDGEPEWLEWKHHNTSLAQWPTCPPFVDSLYSQRFAQQNPNWPHTLLEQNIWLPSVFEHGLHQTLWTDQAPPGETSRRRSSNRLYCYQVASWWMVAQELLLAGWELMPACTWQLSWEQPSYQAKLEHRLQQRGKYQQSSACLILDYRAILVECEYSYHQQLNKLYRWVEWPIRRLHWRDQFKMYQKE